MASQESGAYRAAALYPSPPPFYKHFTPENIRRLDEARDAAGVAQASELDVNSLPAELRFLIPPNLPSDGRVNVFGQDTDLTNPLQPLDLQLYPEKFDRQREMLLLSKSLLLSFLELVGLLSTDPSHYGGKIDDIVALFKNIHHLANEYRPHMAREQLIQFMEDRVKNMRKEVEDVDKMKERVEEVLQTVVGEGGALSGKDLELLDSNKLHDTQEHLRRQRVWDALDSIET